MEFHTVELKVINRQNITNAAASVVVLGNQEQTWKYYYSRTLTEIKKEWLDVKLDAQKHFAEAKLYNTWMEGGQANVTVTEMDNIFC